MDFEVLLDHCQLEHGEEVDGGFFKACCDAAGVFKPADAAFDDVSLFVGNAIE